VVLVKEIVTVLLMVERMTVMRDVRENLYAVVTTAESSDSTTIQKMTAVMNHPPFQRRDLHLSSFQEFLLSLLQARDVRVVTMPLAGDAALLRILAMKEKVTVMER